MSEDADQVWRLTVAGSEHRVEVRGSLSRRLAWYVDGEQVAKARSSDDRVTLRPADRPGPGVVRVRFSGLGSPRRATLVAGHDDAPELDLDPDPGSPAARHEQRVRSHPRRYAVVQTLGGVARVVVPIVLATLLARLAFAMPWPDWDLPGLPSIPWPDLPRIPWPDLPSIPWPDWQAPDWLVWALEHAKYVWPVLLAAVLARAEIRRRRRQDELRAGRHTGADDRQVGSADGPHEGCHPRDPDRAEDDEPTRDTREH